MQAGSGTGPAAPTAPGRGRRRYTVLGTLVGAPLLATACGSAGPSGTSSTKARPTSQPEIALSCRQVADVLSDGPDPSADPVGYALAQVRPLRQVRTTDKALKQAVDQLASAYETVYKTNAATGTAAAVKKADKAVDQICPGATS